MIAMRPVRIDRRGVSDGAKLEVQVHEGSSGSGRDLGGLAGGWMDGGECPSI